MKLIDPDHPSFSKPWVRWATTLGPIAWSVVEFSTGNPGWGAIFLGAGIYAGLTLLRRKKPPAE